MFLLIVVVIPFLIGFVVEYLSKNSNVAGHTCAVFVAILFFTWFFGGIGYGITVQRESYVSETYHLSSISKNGYIKSTTSKSSVHNATVEKYEYFLNNNNEYRSYTVDAEDASVVIKEGALDLEVIRERYEKNFLTKYVIPSFFIKNYNEWYKFYVDPKIAQENLGIVIGGK
jgi:hypothetical protein